MLSCSTDRNNIVTHCDFLLGTSTHLSATNVGKQQKKGGRTRANMLSTAPSFDATGVHVFPQRLQIPNMIS